MIRLATFNDLDVVVEIYDEIHTLEEEGKVTIGWDRNIYPTRQSAIQAIEAKELFVEIDDGKIVASAKINQEQVPEYALASWQYDAKDEEIMVIHTLTVSPSMKGKGYGKAFVKFYENYALEHNCSYLRMDTNEKNTNARALYQKLGYKEVGVVPCVFNGIEGVSLVCIEKKIDKNV